MEATAVSPGTEERTLGKALDRLIGRLSCTGSPSGVGLCLLPTDLWNAVGGSRD